MQQLVGLRASCSQERDRDENRNPEEYPPAFGAKVATEHGSQRNTAGLLTGVLASAAASKSL